jgi:hypothetical protein
MIFLNKIFKTKDNKQELIKNKTAHLICSDRSNIKKQNQSEVQSKSSC